jgi:hypothetical protein
MTGFEREQNGALNASETVVALPAAIQRALSSCSIAHPRPRA